MAKTNVELTTEVLLFGTESVLDEVTASIYNAVQRYIISNFQSDFLSMLNKTLLVVVGLCCMC